MENKIITEEKKIKILELCDAFYPVVDGVVAVVKNYYFWAKYCSLCTFPILRVGIGEN